MDLKYLLFYVLISCLSMSCGPNSQTEVIDVPVVESNTNATNTSSTIPTNYSQTLKDPVMGGPADFSFTIANSPGGNAFLIGILGDQRFKSDSTQVQQNGLIRFQKSEGYPQGHYFIYFSNNRNIQFLLGEDQQFKVTADMNDLAGTVKVDGSIDNKLLYDNLLFEQNLRPRLQQVAQELQAQTEGTSAYNEVKARQDVLVAERKKQLNDAFKQYPKSIYTAFKTAGQNPDPRMDLDEQDRLRQYRHDFWANVDFSDTRILRTPVIINKLKRYLDELTPLNQDSVTQSALWLIDRAEPYPDYFKFFANWVPINYEPQKTKLMDPEMVLVNVIQRYFTKEKAFWADSMSIYGFQNRASEMQNSLVGMKGQNVTSTDPNGKKKTLLDLTADYLIVYMYNPDCEHCMEQTPKLVDFYNANRNNGIDVYAIAVDTDDQKWKDYIAKTGMTFTNVHDPTNRSIYKKYYVDHTPELYVLNKDRTIIAKNLKVNQIQTVIDRDRG